MNLIDENFEEKKIKEDKNKKNNQENEQDNIEEEYEYFTINNNIKYVNDEIYSISKLLSFLTTLPHVYYKIDFIFV